VCLKLRRKNIENTKFYRRATNKNPLINAPSVSELHDPVAGRLDSILCRAVYGDTFYIVRVVLKNDSCCIADPQTLGLCGCAKIAPD